MRTGPCRKLEALQGWRWGGGTGGKEHSRLTENSKLSLGWSMLGMCEEQQGDSVAAG